VWGYGMLELFAFKNIKFVSLLFGLNLLNAIDLIESKTALANGFLELNPLVNFFYNMGIFEIGKLGMVALVTIGLLVLHKYDKKLALGCVVILVGWYIFVVAWNLIQLL
jgi:hypothetical protein